MRRNILISLGFILFIIGMTSLFLGLSGVVLSIMKPIERLGPNLAFGTKIVMIIIGFVLAYLGYSYEQNDIDE